ALSAAMAAAIRKTKAPTPESAPRPASPGVSRLTSADGVIAGTFVRGSCARDHAFATARLTKIKPPPFSGVQPGAEWGQDAHRPSRKCKCRQPVQLPTIDAARRSAISPCGRALPA